MMVQNDMSIDLLLGLGLTPEVTATGSTLESGDAAAVPFADVLSGLLMSLPGTAARPIDSGEPGADESAARRGFMVPTTVDELPSPVPDDPKQTLTPAKIMNLTGEGKTTTATPEQPHQTDIQIPSDSINEKLAAFNEDIRAELPVTALAPNMLPRRFTDFVPRDLRAGNYDVIDSRLNNSTLHLTLAPREGAEPIKISLPVDMFTDQPKSATEPGPTTGRVDLGVAPKQAPDVGQLLARLNIKQIEVSQNSVAGLDKNESPSITVSGEDNGRRIDLQGLLPREQTHTNPMAVRPAPVATVLPSPAVNVPPELKPRARFDNVPGRAAIPVITDESAGPLVMSARSVDGLESVVRNTNPLDLKMSHGFVKQTVVAPGFSALTDIEQSSDLFAGLSNFGASDRIGNRETPVRTVRFSLPDNLQTQLQPNGQSVSIKIEPEHLGPARLSLTISHEKLRARVTVETVEIKAIVERSLDRLTTQLAKAGIEVDKIEVAIDGRQAGDELLNRHPMWRRSGRPSRFDPELMSEFTPTNTTPMVPPNRTYIGPAGVNVLA